MPGKGDDPPSSFVIQGMGRKRPWDIFMVGLFGYWPLVCWVILVLTALEFRRM